MSVSGLVDWGDVAAHEEAMRKMRLQGNDLLLVDPDDRRGWEMIRNTFDNDELPAALCGSAISTLVDSGENVFMKVGDLWHMTYRGFTPPLMSHLEGYHDIWRLIVISPRNFSCQELRSDSEDEIGSIEIVEPETLVEKNDWDYDEILPYEARERIQKEIDRLQKAMKNANVDGDLDRAVKLSKEIDRIQFEVRLATGMAGKSRPFPKDSENARKTVGNRIRKAFDAIEKECPALAKHFRESIKLGNTIAYLPRERIDWET
jgi:hypothetical protein